MPKRFFSGFTLICKACESKSKGFTLIEILVVISIVGILLTMSVIGLKGAQSSARDAERKADLEDMRSSFEIFRADCGVYPAENEVTAGQILQKLCAGATNTYMSQIPTDPGRGTTRYEYSVSGSTYTICAKLENSSATLFNCGGNNAKNCNAGGCNYSVRNP